MVGLSLNFHRNSHHTIRKIVVLRAGGPPTRGGRAKTETARIAGLFAAIRRSLRPPATPLPDEADRNSSAASRKIARGIWEAISRPLGDCRLSTDIVDSPRESFARRPSTTEAECHSQPSCGRAVKLMRCASRQLARGRAQMCAAMHTRRVTERSEGYCLGLNITQAKSKFL